MDRRGSSGQKAPRPHQNYLGPQRDSFSGNPYQDYTARRVDRPTVRQVSGSIHGRKQVQRYSTEGGLSPAKLYALNTQLGWSSEETSEPSRELDIKKQRQEKPQRRASNNARNNTGKRVSSNQARRDSRTSRRRDLGNHSRQREISDDFYYREKPGHQRVTSGQPLVKPRTSSNRRRSSGHRRTHRARTSSRRKASRDKTKAWKRWLLIAAIITTLLAVIVGIAVGVTKHKKHGGGGSAPPVNSSLTAISPDSIPAYAKGTYLDPFTWYDTTDFNLTFTNATAGGLFVIGLNTTFSNSVQANPTVPALTDPWPYGTRPIRGVNIGGWLSLEPFITPSLFNTTAPSNSSNVYKPPYADEWTLSTAFGATAANALLDRHYSQFANRSTFEAIRAAGFDHVRIPFPYWSVQTYPGDPYIPLTSWRYLLRGIEYARQNGLRVNLDLHSAPGSQNGWNHSGREGPINWLNGTDGTLNAQRTLDIHRQLAEFFAQDRYKGLVTLYGILNEPRTIFLDRDTVVNWTATAIRHLRSSPLPSDTVLVLSDGFESLPYWHTAFASPEYADIIPAGSNASAQRLLLDSHEYVIFNRDQLMLNHSAKLDFACAGWSQQVQQSMNPTTGFGSFMCGEWSQADTDCATRLNPEGVGNRWEGTLRTDNTSTSVLVPSCPLANAGQGSQCRCGKANADPSSYSDGYKKWLRQFADAQLRSFGEGWGSFYWTWDVEDGVEGAAQWSWRKGVEAGILPSNVAEGGTALWDCSGGGEEDWGATGLDETF